MGKRSQFERNPRDFYKTPLEAIRPLISFLPDGYFKYAEPNAGDGALINGLKELTDFRAKCTFACDIEPQEPWIIQKDAFTITEQDVSSADYIIGNPPWKRTLLHPMITHFSDLRPTWLLFDANWLFTKQAKPYLDRLVMTVTVGRVKWIPGSKMTGKDDCCWYLFSKYARDITDSPSFFGKGVDPTPKAKLTATTHVRLKGNMLDDLLKQPARELTPAD